LIATRESVELESDEILRDAGVVDVAFLVVGDPFGSVRTETSGGTELI
jgi:diphthine synthase